jgi:hypothetical protein
VIRTAACLHACLVALAGPGSNASGTESPRARSRVVSGRGKPYPLIPPRSRCLISSRLTLSPPRARVGARGKRGEKKKNLEARRGVAVGRSERDGGGARGDAARRGRSARQCACRFRYDSRCFSPLRFPVFLSVPSSVPPLSVESHRKPASFSED